jgi:large subunit ribosomal protein L25
MKHPQLNVEKRSVVGKKVRKLRREGILPANIYGKELESVSVQVPVKDFEEVFKQVGETGLVDLMLEGERRPILIKNLQLAYPLRTPIHADFFQVNLKEKVKTMVPLVIVGEAKAVTENIGLLMHPASEIEVEALPEALPENIEVNVENLAAIDDQITVADLKIPGEVTVLTDPGQVVAKIGELVIEEPEPEPEAPAEGEEGAEGETLAEGAEGEESGEKAEGEEGKNEEKPAEEKKEE